uniref:Ovate family protein n=1 Tax=Caenorhabditis tropicalis TaxID=1561998 RepID=A0A1I7T6W5_9PELO
MSKRPAPEAFYDSDDEEKMDRRNETHRFLERQQASAQPSTHQPEYCLMELLVDDFLRCSHNFMEELNKMYNEVKKKRN